MAWYYVCNLYSLFQEYVYKKTKTSVTIMIEKNINVTFVNLLHICMCPRQVYIELRRIGNLGEGELNETWTIHDSLWCVMRTLIKIYPSCSPMSHEVLCFLNGASLLLVDLKKLCLGWWNLNSPTTSLSHNKLDSVMPPITGGNTFGPCLSRCAFKCTVSSHISYV